MVAQSDARPTGGQDVTGSSPTGSGNILSWKLIMKYFLRWSSPSADSKRAVCPFLVKECAHVLITAQATKPAQ